MICSNGRNHYSAENVFRNGTSTNFASHDSANAGNGFQRQKVLDMGLRNFSFGYFMQNEGAKDVFGIDIDRWSG